MNKNDDLLGKPCWQDEHTGLPKYLSAPTPGSRGWKTSSEKSKTNPSHYQMGNIQVWDFIIDQDLDFLLGNVIKYVCRAGHKDDEIKDLQKAKRYIEMRINELEGKEINE